jgi:copper chaperone NosL
MKRSTCFLLLLMVVSGLSGCRDQQTLTPPKPFALTADAVGHYCGMNLTEHAGPKGQIILASQDWPVWFSSAREALSFTMLAEEAKDIRAIYVSDMAKAKSWDQPGADNWVEARNAFFVIGSRKRGGMGAPETIPFSTRPAAERFMADNGGSVVTFAQVPRDYVLGSGTQPDGSAQKLNSGEAGSK